MKKNFYSSLFYKILTVMFLCMMIAILGVDLIIDHTINYSCKINVVNFPNYVLLPIGIITIIIFYLIYNKVIKKHIDKLSKKECNSLLLVACIFILCLQLFYAYNIYFLSGWDVGALRNTAIQIGNGNTLSQLGNSYYAMYPNNVFLLFIQTIIYEIQIYVGVIDFGFALVVIGVLLINISIWFVVKCGMLILKDRHYVILMSVVYIICVAFSPWIVIPYSDTYVLLFTVSILYFYLNRKNTNIRISWFLIFIFSFIGYSIKPTCIIVFIAIMLVEFWKFLFIDFRKKINIIKSIIPILLIALLAHSSVIYFSHNYIGYVENKESEFPLTHFLMMGMNEETQGIYYDKDVIFTTSYSGKENKIKANIDVVKKRLSKYGLNGYIKLLIYKTLINYNDGTFAWGVEGSFYENIPNIKYDTISPLLRDITYTQGKYYHHYATFQQCIWITILFLIILSVKTIARTRDDGIYIIVLTIIGITLFLLLFEARARYLFLYLPYYIILSFVGLKNLIYFIGIKMDKYNLRKIKTL